jgi:hypothetical protein
MSIPISLDVNVGHIHLDTSVYTYIIGNLVIMIEK